MDARHQEIARCLFRESNDALFLFDPVDHRVVDVNPVALRLTGFDLEDACAMSLRDLFTSAEQGGLGRLIDAYRRTGFYHSREGYFLSRAAGEPIPVNVSVSRMHTSPEPLGLVVARDVSERVRAQEALAASESRYRSLVEAANLVVWEVSARGTVVSLNPAFEAITGRDASGLVGRPFGELFQPGDREAAVASVARGFRQGPAPPYDLRVASSDGEALVFEVLSVTRRGAKGAEGVTGIARDVTGQRRAAEALQRTEALRREKDAAEAADRAKSEFLGNISHEIRTPMTAILGFTEVLIDDESVRGLPDDLYRHLLTIRQNGSHLLDLINDILDMTKIEAGKLRIDPVACSPVRIAEDVAASMRPRAEGKGLRLDVEVAPGVPRSVRTDPVRLRQILINLLSNAVKFTQAGGVRFVVRPAPGALRFEVVDTGVGLSEDDIGHLFESFYTSDHRRTRESGAGLGLAISRRLAEMLGGRIGVTSRPGQGSTFAFEVPVGAAEAPAEPATAADAPPHAADRPSAPSAHARAVNGSRIDGRILLAEDNDSIREYMAVRLQRAGAEVATAANGREAVDLALAARDEGRPFDWILMDVQMPVLDGYEATRLLRGEGYRHPIIALTAFAVAGNREECLRFGCDDHVSKPIDWPRFLEVLAETRQTAPREGPVTA